MTTLDDIARRNGIDLNHLQTSLAIRNVQPVGFKQRIPLYDPAQVLRIVRPKRREKRIPVASPAL